MELFNLRMLLLLHIGSSILREMLMGQGPPCVCGGTSGLIDELVIALRSYVIVASRIFAGPGIGDVFA